MTKYKFNLTNNRNSIEEKDPVLFNESTGKNGGIGVEKNSNAEGNNNTIYIRQRSSLTTGYIYWDGYLKPLKPSKS